MERGGEMAMTQVQAVSAEGWYAKVGEHRAKVLYWLFGVDLEATPPTYMYRGIVWHPKQTEFVSAQSLSAFVGFFYESQDRTKKVNLENLEQWLIAHGAGFAATDVNRWKEEHIKRYVLAVLGAKEAEDAGLVEDDEIKEEP